MELAQLKQIGLTDGEIRVYQALLELGECTKTKLAKESAIAPSNIYDVTNRLIEKGLISKVEINGIAHFSPANPNKIFNYLDEKTKQIEEEKNLAKQILPELLLKSSEKKDQTKVEVFNGWQGMKTVFDELINECNTGDECVVFGASKGSSEKTVDTFFTKYSKLRSQKGIKTKIIFNTDVQNTERIKFFLQDKNYTVRFLNQNTPAEIMVYKNKSCIIMLSKDPLIIRINSIDAAESFKQQFEVLWKQASTKN